MKSALLRVKKLELANKDKLALTILFERTRLYLEEVFSNIAPDRRIEDFEVDADRCDS